MAYLMSKLIIKRKFPFYSVLMTDMIHAAEGHPEVKEMLLAIPEVFTIRSEMHAQMMLINLAIFGKLEQHMDLFLRKQMEYITEITLDVACEVGLSRMWKKRKIRKVSNDFLDIFVPMIDVDSINKRVLKRLDI